MADFENYITKKEFHNTCNTMVDLVLAALCNSSDMSANLLHLVQNEVQIFALENES